MGLGEPAGVGNGADDGLEAGDGATAPGATELEGNADGQTWGGALAT